MVLLAFYVAQCGDDEMARELRAGLDPHRETAKKTLGIDDPSDAQRQVAKRVNFSIVYGGGAPTLISQLGITKPEALTMLDTFHAARPGIQLLQRAILIQVVMRGLNLAHPMASAMVDSTEGWERSRLYDKAIAGGGYITTLWGRHLRPESLHKALNALIQGCAADLMRQALRTVSAGLKAEGMTSHLVSVVHDEFILDCVRQEMARLYELMPRWMDWEPISRVVPVTTEMEASFTTWADKALWVPEGIAA
jgi:DNA polymerase-1